MSDFLHVGNNSFVNISMIDCIIPADTNKVKKFIKKKAIDPASVEYLDTCKTPEIKSLIVLTDGKVVVSMLTPNTLNKRLNNNLEE